MTGLIKWVLGVETMAYVKLYLMQALRKPKGQRAVITYTVHGLGFLPRGGP